MRACDVMTAPVITVTPDTTVKEAANLLASRGFTALPVVDGDERLIGIVTEVDLVRDRFPRDARYRRSADHEIPRAQSMGTVGDVMTSPATAMGAATDVVDVVTVMWDSKIRALPIVDGSRVVGIVTRCDLVAILGRADDAIANDVRHALAHYAGTGRWTVDVRDGVVSLGDEYEDESERHVATVLAEGVPGVVAARVTSIRH